MSGASQDFSKMRAEFRRELRDGDLRTPDWSVLWWSVLMVCVVAAVTTVAVVYG